MSTDPRLPPHVHVFVLIDPVNKIARCTCGLTYRGG